MSSTLSNEKASLAGYQRKCREFSSRVDIIVGLEHEVKGLIELEKGIEDQRSNVEEAKRKLDGLRKRLDDKGIESSGLDAKLGVSQVEGV
jgi:kinetochore protein Nuf2